MGRGFGDIRWTSGRGIVQKFKKIRQNIFPSFFSPLFGSEREINKAVGDTNIPSDTEQRLL